MTIGDVWFKHAIYNGTHSWDIRISKMMSIALQSATDSRAGDLCRSHGYHELECLCWKDIDLKLTKGGKSIQDFIMTVTVRFEKGYK